MKPYLKALRTGTALMLLCALFVAFPYALLFILYFLPGLVFGIFLLAINDDENKGWKNIVFLIIATFTYVACIPMISLLDTDFRLLDPLRIVYASCIGSVVLSIAYQKLILNRFSFRLTLVTLLFVGLVCSVPSALLLYIFNEYHDVNSDNTYINKLLMSSIFIVFPLWQTIFVALLGIRPSPFELPDVVDK